LLRHGLSIGFSPCAVIELPRVAGRTGRSKGFCRKMNYLLLIA
jgi:hypothetical protein